MIKNDSGCEVVLFAEVIALQLAEFSLKYGLKFSLKYGLSTHEMEFLFCGS